MGLVILVLDGLWWLQHAQIRGQACNSDARIRGRHSVLHRQGQNQDLNEEYSKDHYQWVNRRVSS
jgi:hypothetical protein